MPTLLICDSKLHHVYFINYLYNLHKQQLLPQLPFYLQFLLICNKQLHDLLVKLYLLELC